MRLNPKNNFLIDESLAAASRPAGSYAGSATDHSLYPAAAYIISVGSLGTGGTVDAKLQISDDGTTWVDDDGSSGNEKSITQITSVGKAFLYVHSPYKRYSKVSLTIGTAACVTSVMVFAGPKRHVEAA